MHIRAITYMDRSALIACTNGSRSHKNQLTNIAITDNYSKWMNKRASLNLWVSNIGIKISLYIRVDIRPCCNILQPYIKYI
jgi:hypothetical protein